MTGLARSPHFGQCCTKLHPLSEPSGVRDETGGEIKELADVTAIGLCTSFGRPAPTRKRALACLVDLRRSGDRIRRGDR